MTDYNDTSPDTQEQKILTEVVDLLHEIHRALLERQERMDAPFFRTSRTFAQTVGEELALREIELKLNKILYGWARKEERRWKRVLLDMVDGDPRRYADYVKHYERLWNQEREEPNE